MSVINKMLRDLDRRGAPSEANGIAPLRSEAPTAPSGAWRPRVPPPRTRQRPGVPWGLVAVGSALIAAMEFWPWRAAPVAPMFPPAGSAPAAAPIAQAPAPETTPDPTPTPTPTASAQISPPAPPAEPAPAPAVAAPSAMATATAATQAPSRADAPALKTSAETRVPPVPLGARVAGPSPAPAAPSPAAPQAPAAQPTTPSATAPAASSPVNAPLPTVSARPPAPTPTATIPTPPVPDTLGQAQALAASGALDGALAVLNEGLQRATATGDTTQGLALLREAVRLSLTEGRLQTAWALLQRHEAWLSGQAELWAQRGHVAQRLGEHRDSARAYQQALALRPSEARWQLGAAVSLAALGQTQAAAEWAERARAQGPVNPQVLDYLRQSGVVLRP